MSEPFGRGGLSDVGYRLSEAIEPLLTLALIKRDKDSRAFSCHRLVQTQFRSYLPSEERQQAFNNATALVYHAFPKQSDATNKNQFYQQWAQHVICLEDNFKEERKHSKEFKTSSLFYELLQKLSKVRDHLL
jgi:hypothetical protein